MTRARVVLFVALLALGLAACGGGVSTPPRDDDPDTLSRVSASVVGYADTDAVVVEGRSTASGALIALGVLHGFAARLDLELIDPADIPGGALMPPDLPNCDVALTPASLRTADFVDVRSPDGSLTLQLRNRPFGAEPVGSEYYGFMVANVDGSIAVTCDDGDVQVSLDATVQAGWNVVGVRITAYEEGVFIRLEGASIDAVPADAAWYVAP